MTRIELLDAAVICFSLLSSNPSASGSKRVKDPLSNAVDFSVPLMVPIAEGNGLGGAMAPCFCGRLDAYYVSLDAGRYLMTNQEKLQGLMDREEISEVLYNYAMGPTRRTKSSSAQSGPTRSRWMALAGFMVRASRRPSTPTNGPAFSSAPLIYAVTQHVMISPKIEVNGDQAKSVVSMQCRLFAQGWKQGDPIYEMGGFYTHNLIRTPQGWRIKSYCLHITWDLNRPAGWPLTAAITNRNSASK